MDYINGHRLTRLKNGWRIISGNTVAGDGLLTNIQQFIFADTPDSWVQVESSRNSKVWKFFADNKWYIIKEYLHRSPFEYLKVLLKGSRAAKAWEKGKELRKRGFLTHEMIVFGEKLFFCFPTRNFLVSTLIPDAVGLYTFIKNNLNAPLDMEKIQFKRSIIYALGKTIGRLHAVGIVHGDLRLDNVMLKKSGDECIFYLIDNERNTYFKGRIPQRLRLKNLVQINMIVLPQVTLTDRWRFLKAYLNENPELKPVAKDWMRKIFLMTKKRLQKKVPDTWE